MAVFESTFFLFWVLGLFNVLVEEYLELENLEIYCYVVLLLFLVFLTFQDREGGEVNLAK